MCVCVTSWCVMRSPRQRCEQRVDVRRQQRPRVEHRHVAATDHVRARAVIGERARVVRHDAANQRRERARDGVLDIRFVAIRDGHGRWRCHITPRFPARPTRDCAAARRAWGGRSQGVVRWMPVVSLALTAKSRPDRPRLSQPRGVMSDRQILPVVPLRGTVIFPGLAVPIGIGREATLRAIEAAVKTDQRVFAVAQRENVDKPDPSQIHTDGCDRQDRSGPAHAGRCAPAARRPHARLGARVPQGRGPPGSASRCRCARSRRPTPKTPRSSRCYQELRARATALASKRGVPEPVLAKVMEAVTDPGAFVDLAAGTSSLSLDEKQALLEMTVVEERMRKVLVLIQRMIDLLEAREEIQSQVQEELGERQREMFLREQMKAIQRELGEDDRGRRGRELRARLEALELPEEARTEVDRELGRLERAGRESTEAQVIRTYLEWIAELPWSTRTEDQLDLARAQQVLDEDHYGLADVKDRVLEFLAVRQLQATARAERRRGAGPRPCDATPTAAASPRPRPDAKEAKARAMAKGPILLFIGPPGVGKTSIAQVDRALARPRVRAHRARRRARRGRHPRPPPHVRRRDARPHHPGHEAGRHQEPGVPARRGRQARRVVPGRSGGGAARGARPGAEPHLHRSLPERAVRPERGAVHRHRELRQNIPAPLLDRMEVVEFAGYTEREKAGDRQEVPDPAPARGGGPRRQRASCSTDAAVPSSCRATRARAACASSSAGSARWPASSRASSRAATADPAGDRAGRRARAARPAARAPGAARRERRGRRGHRHVLHAGGRRHHVRRGVDAHGCTRSGAATACRCTRIGRRVADPHRPARRRDEGVGARGADLRRRPTREYARHPDGTGWPIEAHIHVPAGAMPKDGPSAGVAMATALVSAMSGRPVRREVAMTGEITLRGRVLPIGGVKEKVLGAHRAGITARHPAEGQRGRPRGPAERDARAAALQPGSLARRGVRAGAARRAGCGAGWRGAAARPRPGCCTGRALKRETGVCDMWGRARALHRTRRPAGAFV